MRCAWVLYEIAKFTLNWSKNWLIHFTFKLNIEGRKEMVALMVFCKCWGDSRELLVSLERSLPALAANAVNIPLWQVSSSRPNHVFFCTSVTNFYVHVSAASVYPWSIPSSSIVSECVHEWGAAERGRIPDRSLQSKPHQQETFSQPFTCLACQLYTCTWYTDDVCVSRIISTMTEVSLKQRWQWKV